MFDKILRSRQTFSNLCAENYIQSKILSGRTFFIFEILWAIQSSEAEEQWNWQTAELLIKLIFSREWLTWFRSFCPAVRQFVKQVFTLIEFRNFLHIFLLCTGTVRSASATGPRALGRFKGSVRSWAQWNAEKGPIAARRDFDQWFKRFKRRRRLYRGSWWKQATWSCQQVNRVRGVLAHSTENSFRNFHSSEKQGKLVIFFKFSFTDSDCFI